MKKSLSSILMGVLLIFSSCQNEDDFSNSGSLEVNQTLNTRLYGVKLPDADATRGVAIANKLWHNGTTISVRLLNDPYNMSAKVKSWAGEWEKYANIKFNFVDSGDALVRIGFDWNDSKSVTWSYTGTDCKYVRDENEATVNFAYWDATSETEKRGDVLRAFGQVLGLELEHRHLSFDPGWRNNISKYWEGEITDITWDELKKYVFDPLENSSNIIQTTEYDANSIMVWPFSAKYAKNTARSYNYDLSDQDIEFIKKVYPKELIEKSVALFNVKGLDGINVNHAREDFKFILFVSEDTSFTVDYGDGTTATISTKYKNCIISKDYKVAGNYTVKVYGNLKLITEILTRSYLTFNTIPPVELADISGCTELTKITLEDNFRIKIGSNGLSRRSVHKLDISKNTKLKEIISLEGGYVLNGLDISNNKELVTLKGIILDNKTTLNTSNNTKLETLGIAGEKLTTLDLSKNTALTNLYINIWTDGTMDPNIPLTSIDLSANKKLKELSCKTGNLVKLDLKNNSELETLNLFDCTNLSSVDLTKNPKLHTLVSQFSTSLYNLDLTYNVNLSYINGNQSAFFTDKDALVKFVNLLPNIPGGLLFAFGSRDNQLYIENICRAKGWNILY